MLRFKEYRNKFIESTPDTSSQPETSQATNIQNQINQIVDTWVTDLKRTLMNPMTPLAQRRGIWDRFKNTMSNMWHGRYNQTNPYFWKNKLGDDLGSEDLNSDAQESFNPNNLSLSDYKSLRDICESLEEQLNEDGTENLRLVRIIDDKAKELKKALMSIVGGGEIDSPDTSVPNSPTQPQSEPQEEPNSKIEKGTDDVISVIDSFVKHGKIDAIKGQNLINRLKDKKHSVRNAAFDEFLKIKKEIDDATNQNSPDANHPVSPVNPENQAEKGSMFTPPSNEKRWDELNPDEKDKWDIYGGGASHGHGTKIDGCLNDHGIFKMPWIMRIGDPRRNILAAQKEGRLPNSHKCNNKKIGSHWFDFLHRLGRWELDSEPIKDAMELHSKIEKAKANTEEARRRMPRSTATSDVDATKNAISDVTPSTPTSTPPTPTPTPTSTPPPTPSLKDRVASIDTSALSEPMHKNTESNPIDSSPKDMNPKNRVSTIDGTDGIKNTNKEEFKSVKEMKNELKTRIDALSDEDTKEQLLRTLKNLKDKSSIDDFEEELSTHELSNMEIEWTATDVKNFYKQRLIERKGIPQLVKHEIDDLSFTERVHYFKEQLQTPINNMSDVVSSLMEVKPITLICTLSKEWKDLVVAAIARNFNHSYNIKAFQGKEKTEVYIDIIAK